MLRDREELGAACCIALVQPCPHMIDRLSHYYAKSGLQIKVTYFFGQEFS